MTDGAIPLDYRTGEGTKPVTTPAFQQGTGGFKEGFMQESIWSMPTLATPNLPDPEYDNNAWERIKGTELEDYWESFAEVRNAGYEAALREQITNHIRYRNMSEGTGFFSMNTLGQVVGGLSDPTIFMPGAGVVKAVKGGYTVSRSALSVGSAAATGVAAQELLLGQNPVRPLSESAINIGGGFILGGLLGSTAAGLLNRSANVQALKAWEEIDQMFKPQPVGAESRQQVTIDEMTVDGAIARGVVNSTRKVNAGLRMITSMSAKMRQFGLMATDGTLYLRMNNKGDVPFEGPSVEVAARALYSSRYGQALTNHDTFFKEARKEGFVGSKGDFNEAVSRAIRNPDEFSDPHITNAAQEWKERVLDTFKEDMKDVNLLPRDLTLDDGIGYLMRMYRHQYIIENRPDLERALSVHVEDMVKQEFAEQQKKLTERIAGYEQDIAEMHVAPEERIQWLEDINLRREQLLEQNPRAFELMDELRDLRRTARQTGDVDAKRAVREFEKKNADVIGPVRSELTSLTRKRRNIEAGFAARDARIEKIDDQLIKFEEQTQAYFDRYFREAKKHERDMARAGEETRQELIEKFSESSEKLQELLAETGKKYDALEDQIAKNLEAHRKEVQAATDDAGSNFEGLKAQQELSTAFAKASQVLSDRARKMKALQAGRIERLMQAYQRLQEAEAFDPDAAQQALTDLITAIKVERASKALDKGMRAQRLMDRLAELDPKRNEKLLADKERLQRRLDKDDFKKPEDKERVIKELEKVQQKLADDPVQKRIDEIAARKDKTERGFYDKWEIKRSGQDLANDPRFKDYADDIVTEAIDKILGKTHAMTDSPDSWKYFVTIGRGPMKERTLKIPDEVLDELGMLNNDITEVADRYARISAVETQIAKRFGTNNLDEILEEVTADYAKIRNQIGAINGSVKVDGKVISEEDRIRELIARTPGVLDRMSQIKGRTFKQRALALLERDELQSKQDFRDMISIQRGMYAADKWSSNWGKISRSANMFNYIRLSGRFAISSLPDLYRTAMVHGLRNTFANGIGPLLGNLDAVKMSIKEAKDAGLIVERVLHHKMISMMEVGNQFAQKTAVENLLHNGSRFATMFNGMAFMQDGVETVASIMSQRRIINGIIEGKDERYLAMLNLGPAMRDRIRKQLATHKRDIDGVPVAMTDAWTDTEAVRAFRGALNKDVRSTAIVPGVADKMTFINTPLGAALFQFRAFSMAAHQRVLLRGLQEKPSLLMSGIVGMTSMGMLTAWLQALSRGEESYQKWRKNAENPGFLIGDALDKSGLFTLMFEVANATEKASRFAIPKALAETGFGGSFNPIKSPLKMAFGGDGGVRSPSRFGGSIEQDLFGPSAKLGTDLAKGIGGLGQAISGGELSKADKRAMQYVMPYGTFLGMKELIQLWAGDSPWMR